MIVIVHLPLNVNTDDHTQRESGRCLGSEQR